MLNKNWKLQTEKQGDFHDFRLADNRKCKYLRAELRCLLTADCWLQAKTNCYWHSPFAKAPDKRPAAIEKHQDIGESWNSVREATARRHSKVICGSLFTFGFYFLVVPGWCPGRARSKTVMDSRLKSGRDTLPFCRNIKPVLFQKLHAKWPDNEPLLLSQLHRGFRDSNQEDEAATFKLGNFAWLHSKQQSSNRGAFLLFAYSFSKLKNKLIMRSCHWRQLQPHQKENSGGKSVHWDTVRDLENSCWAFFLSRSIYLNIYTDIHTYIYVHSIFDSSFDSPIRLGVHDHVHLDLLPLFFFFALLLPTPLVLKFNCIFFNNSSTKWKFMQTLADKNGIPKPSVPPQKDERDEA